MDNPGSGRYRAIRKSSAKVCSCIFHYKNLEKTKVLTQRAFWAENYKIISQKTGKNNNGVNSPGQPAVVAILSPSLLLNDEM
jgi:hypothetical protein